MSGLDHLDYHDLELLAEVHEVVSKIHRLAGGPARPVPPLGSPAWRDAPLMAKVAGLLVLSEAWLVHDPDRRAAERLRALSGDLSSGHDWAAAGRRPSYAELQRRRGQAGPLAGLVFDPAAARRWVRTGSSEEAAA